MINQRLEAGSMPRFAAVELRVLDVDSSSKAAVAEEEESVEEEGDDAGEEQGEEEQGAEALNEEEQVEEAKQEGVRTQWLDTLRRAGPAFVEGLPLKLNATDPVFDRIFATKSTFFLSHGGPVSIHGPRIPQYRRRRIAGGLTRLYAWLFPREGRCLDWRACCP